MGPTEKSHCYRGSPFAGCCGLALLRCRAPAHSRLPNLSSPAARWAATGSADAGGASPLRDEGLGSGTPTKLLLRGQESSGCGREVTEKLHPGAEPAGAGIEKGCHAVGRDSSPVSLPRFSSSRQVPPTGLLQTGRGRNSRAGCQAGRARDS